MENISFQGGFLIKKPSVRMWNSIQESLPKKKCVFQEFEEKGDKFFVIKSVYDKAMANILLAKKNLEFKFYPDINLKNRLDSYYPNEAIELVKSQTNVIETKQGLRQFIKASGSKRSVIQKYRWKPNDHIDKTFKAVGLNSSEHTVQISNGITFIKNKKGKIVAKASPNNQNGVNFVYVYPKNTDESSRKFALSQDGEIYEFSPLEIVNFQKLFLRNVKIDLGRKRPEKKS